MAMLRTHACTKRLALGFRSAFKRWISVDFGEELSKGKTFAAVWGNGDFGRLGLGNLESQWRPKPIPPAAFDDQSLKEIACGGAHTLFLTENGDVYATGLNDYRQLGVSDSQNYTTIEFIGNNYCRSLSGFLVFLKELLKFHLVAIIQLPLQSKAQHLHLRPIQLLRLSFVKPVDGELYMWGKNANGQLGLGKKAEKIVPHPSKVQCLDGIAIKMISLGFEHSIAVTDEGEVLSWGGGESGRLGHGHESSILGFQMSSSEYTPRLIKELEGVKVKSVSAGMLHSACICEKGSVYFFGERELGKWGFGKVKSDTTPSAISTLPCSEEVACGAYHTCVVTNGGELYAWGSNENGCLGIGCTDITYLPERVEGPFLREPVSKVSCGWKHTAAISGGNVYTWGWGGSNGTFKEDGHSPGGQLGQGDDVDYIEPMLLDFHESVKPLQVSCGFNHTAGIFQYI